MLDDLNINCSSNPVLLSITSIGVFQLISLGGLYIYIKINRKLASNGDKNATMNLVLPIYYLVFNYTLLAGTLVATDNVLNILYGNIYVHMFSAKYFLYRWVAEGLAFFLMHNGVGERAFKRSLLLSFLWSILSTSIQLIVFSSVDSVEFYFTGLIMFIILLIFYLLLWLSPSSFLHRRPAAIKYARFYVFTIILTMVALLLVLLAKTSTCGPLLMLAILDYLQPFLVLRALISDSKFWQGINL